MYRVTSSLPRPAVYNHGSKRDDVYGLGKVCKDSRADCSTGRDLGQGVKTPKEPNAKVLMSTVTSHILISDIPTKM